MNVADRVRGRPQRRIGRYLVTGRIGRGGMGMVYRGRDEALERDVAVKTLTAEGTFDQETRARFQIEAKAAARLQHPNIVTIFELGEERGLPFIAMELLPGADLETLLRSGEELLLEEKLDAVAQVARGLAYAHERGVVHRDMKPSNIRLLDDGRAKIMDFGIAKLGASGVTKSGIMVGTVHYMSPEQIRGAALDGRSDVFSLGVILYELLAGRRPFGGSEAAQVLYRIVHEPPAPLEGDWGELVPRLHAVVERALAKDPAARHASAAELAGEIEGILETLRRGRERTPAPALNEQLTVVRRIVSAGPAPEELEELRAIVALYPEEIELRRALRTAQRAAAGATLVKPAADDDFPELDATFQASPTLRATATDVGAAPGAAAPPPRGRRALAAGAAVLLLGAVAAWLAWRPAAPAVPRLLVHSEPAGAAVFLDGRDTGAVTNAEVLLPTRDAPVRLTLRKPGYAEATRDLRPPFPQTPLTFTLNALPVEAKVHVTSDPPGAQVTFDGAERGRTPLDVTYDPARAHKLVLALDGHEPREVEIEPGHEAAELSVTLTRQGPLGTVTVASSYPVDVIWQGRVLARGEQNPRVALPAGRHSLTLVSAQHFLKSTVSVNVQGAADAALQAPGLGRLNVRATPDNCEVHVNGAFADYPPIRNRAVAAGTLTVTFKWPDGTRRDETVELPAGGIEYVTGRKD